MKEESHGIPLACTLPAAELLVRQISLVARFKSGVIATEELPNGYAFRIPGDVKWIIAIAELIAAERECCRFLTFELTAEPNMGPVTVRVTGPAEAKAFLRMTFGISC